MASRISASVGTRNEIEMASRAVTRAGEALTRSLDALAQEIEPQALADSVIIRVCDKCFKAACWQGVFMCDESQCAGTVDKTVGELRKLDLEHSDYWPASIIEQDGVA